MPRQPFLPTYEGEPYSIGQADILQRPDLASLVGGCIALWSDVDLQMALILAALLKTDTDAALAVYLQLRRHANQRETLASAADVVLSGEVLQTFKALLTVHKSTDGDRRDLAHGIFGVLADHPDKLLWTSLQDHAHFLTEIHRLERAGEFRADPHKRLKESMFVYSKACLTSIFDRMFSMQRLAFNFGCFLRDADAERGKGHYQAVLSDAAVQSVLSQASSKGGK